MRASESPVQSNNYFSSDFYFHFYPLDVYHAMYKNTKHITLINTKNADKPSDKQIV